MATKLLPQKYKTFSGAAQRAACKRGLAPFEFQHGYAARLYGYRVVTRDGFYRVERYLPQAVEV